MNIAEITSDLSILRKVVASQIDLDPADYAICPFHHEKTKSLHLFQAKGGKAMFYCHGCGAKGDAIDFLRRLRNANFTEAVDKISRLIDSPVLTSQGPRSTNGAKTIWNEAKGEFCEKDCPKYAALRDDYNALLEENHRLREKLGLPDFTPGEVL